MQLLRELVKLYHGKKFNSTGIILKILVQTSACSHVSVADMQAELTCKHKSGFGQFSVSNHAWFQNLGNRG